MKILLGLIGLVFLFSGCATEVKKDVRHGGRPIVRGHQVQFDGVRRDMNRWRMMDRRRMEQPGFDFRRPGPDFGRPGMVPPGRPGFDRKRPMPFGGPRMDQGKPAPFGGPRMDIGKPDSKPGKELDKGKRFDYNKEDRGGKRNA